MPTQFDDLPYELRHEIFQLAFIADYHPRVVEIFFKNGEIYSKTLPPPLLQVCQLSRYITLLHYKPWLPQFKGLVAHRPWAEVVERKGERNLSSLQNVCIDLKYDMLVIKTKQWSPWEFGKLERKYIKTLAVNLGGWIDWIATSGLARQFKNLRRLALFDNTSSNMLAYKGEMIQEELLRMFRNQEGSRMQYAGPKVSYEDLPGTLEWERDVANWITYKYPKGHKSKTVSKSFGYSVPNKYRQNRTTSSNSSQLSKKRARNSHNQSQGMTSPRKTAKTSHSKVSSRIHPQQIQSVRIYPSNVPLYPSSQNKSPNSFKQKRAIVPSTPKKKENKSSDDRRRSSASTARAPTQIRPINSQTVKPSHAGSTVFEPSPLFDPKAPFSATLSRDWSPSPRSSRCRISSRVHHVSKPARHSSPPFSSSQESFASIWEGSELARSPTPEVRPTLNPHLAIDKLIGPIEPATFTAARRSPELPPRKFVNPFEDWDEIELSFLTAPNSDLGQVSSPAALLRHSSPVAMLIDNLEPEAVISTPVKVGTDEAPSSQSLDEHGGSVEMLDLTYADNLPESLDEFVDINDDEKSKELDLSQPVLNPMDTCRLQELEVRPSETMDLDYPMAVEEPSFTYSHIQSAHMDLGLPILDRDLSFTPPPLTPDLSSYPNSQLSLHSQLPLLEEEEERQIPERIIAERKTARGTQLLIQWETYPEENDWTWEPEDVILEDCPTIVMDWTMNKNDSEPEADAEAENEEGAVGVVYVPEKILSKRKFKGMQHYLVQWEGYPKVEDRTWEPCERFRVDAPLLVECFEMKKMKKKS